METTTNYGLKKPAGSDYYNIEDFNGNADILDAALALKGTAYTSLEQTGLTVDTASSYAAVHNAMPENSTLTISWTGTATTNNFGAFGQLMPAQYGTCVIRRSQVSSWTFYEYSVGAVFSGTYTATNGAGWTGWKNCTIEMPVQSMRYDMGGCADTGSRFGAYGPVTVTKYGKWAKIEFALSIGNVSWGSGVDASSYYAYGIPIATLNSLTGMTLNAATVNSHAVFKLNDATTNGGICGGFQQKGAYLCPGRWYFTNSTYQFGAWTADAPCNTNGNIWIGTINISE